MHRSYSRDRYQNHTEEGEIIITEVVIGVIGPITEITVGPETGTVTEIIVGTTID